MQIRLMLTAGLVLATAIAAPASNAAALPAARPALSGAIDSIGLNADAAARRTVTRKKTVTRRNTVVRKRNVHVDVDRHVHRRVVVRPVRPWVHRPWFGTVVAGVTIGTVIAATTVPTPPAQNLCWFWSDSTNTHGYWDYCTPPR
jgi:hypothetical protein